MNHPAQAISDRQILAARPKKNAVAHDRPYAFLVEPERAPWGEVVDVATLFLTNRECPFRCLMCDLWRNTTDAPVPPGAIPDQIDYALARLPTATCIKLYNSGNFFDAQAIPPADHAAIADRVRSFRRVIVENHPKLCDDRCRRFRDLVGTELEIALGLETIHPDVLPRLNKRMTADDFSRATGFLRDQGIAVRAFILLRPPYLDEEQGVEWALRSMAFAFDAGAECCAVIPTRPGNGIMERLLADGQFTPPSLPSMERVLVEGMAWSRGRVFMDLWDVERFFDCPRCGPARAQRMRAMNLAQAVLPPVHCDCGAPS
jgi:radical SAM enzyme (TIGR01210 family)